MDSFEHDGLIFRVADSGAGDVPVVLLHGFPQGAGSWSGVSRVLSAAGVRVLAPDQRGYSPGARPTGRQAYRLDVLVGDVLALADAAGLDRFYVVGHDWGGAVAWALAGSCSDRLLGLKVLSTPHPRALASSLWRSTQGLRSSYFLFFRLPVVSERVLLAGGGRVLREALVRSGLCRETAASYVRAMEEPGALTAALNWYRAPASAWSVDDIRVPTTYVWSTGDTALGRAAAEATGRYVKAPYRFEVLHDVSHWIPEEAPETVASLVLADLKRGG